RRLPDARLHRRGRRRGPGGLAPAQPHRRQRRAQPGGLADDRRGPGVAGHAAVALVPAGGGERRPPSRRRPPAPRRRRRTTRPGPQSLIAATRGSALPAALATLRPAERLAFVLHALFAVPFDEIPGPLPRSPNAAKQLASRARHKAQGTDPAPDADPARQREVV